MLPTSVTRQGIEFEHVEQNCYHVQSYGITTFNSHGMR